MNFKMVLRQAGAVSFWDALLQLLRLVAVLFAVGFAVYLPVNKYTNPNSTAIPRTWLFAIYVACVLYAQIFTYLPKFKKETWTRIEAQHLRSTNVAVARITACLRNRQCAKAEYQEIGRGLLSAIKLEVQAITLEPDSTYVNASLMVQDPNQAANLIVSIRANDDRQNPSYPKEGLFVWKAMTEYSSIYQSEYQANGKAYQCILALPLVIEGVDGTKTSLGVVSIDSGIARDFDGIVDKIELKTLPYVSLLKLLLTMRTNQGAHHADD